MTTIVCKPLVLRLSWLTLGCAFLSLAQNGVVSGTVKDASGATVPKATVTLVNQDTSTTQNQETGDAGNYTFTHVQPGSYRLESNAKGFKTFVQPNITVDVQQNVSIDPVLEVGQTSETVEVKAETPLLQPNTSSLGQVISNQQITQLPLSGRNTLSLIGLTAGAQPMGQFGGIPARTNAYNQGFFSTSGSQVVTNETLIDGVPANAALYNAPAYVPVVDTVQEFKVQTNSFSAEFGRTGGGVVNIVTKSGTNDLHGSLYDFLRNTHLDANNWFNNLNGIARPGEHTNQFGGAAGGPVIIPGVYNGRNKTFWFVNYEGLRDRHALTQTFTIPTLAQDRGDFSQTFNSAHQLITIYDPLSTRPNPSAPGQYIRTPFANNMVPTSRLDPVAMKAIALYPAPNATGNPISGANNFFGSADVPNIEDQFSVRIDHTINERNRIFGRFAYADNSRGAYDFFHDNAGWVNPGGGGVPLIYNARNAALDYTRVITPTFIFEFRYGFVRQFVNKVPAGYGIDLTTLGFPASLGPQLPVDALPSFQPSGYRALAPESQDLIRRGDNTHSWEGNFTKVLSKQTLTFGADYRFIPIGELQPNSPQPQFNFTAAFTQANPLAASATSGNSIASFLLGYPASGSVDNTPAISISYRYGAGYFQDDYRVTSKLTLNIGLRYEVETARNERYNRLSWFNPAAPNPIGPQIGFPGLTGALQFPGVGGNGTRQKTTNWKNFGPRFGFGYQIANKTVLRGGYGLFYLPSTGDDQGTNLGASGFFTTTTFTSSLNGGITPAGVLSNPFPNGITTPPGSSQGAVSQLGQDLVSVYHNDHSSYAQEWNLDLQQQLPGNFLIDLAYAGNKGTYLPVDIQADQLPDQYLSQGSALLRQVPNPLYGIVTTGPLTGPTVAYGQLLRPFPQFNSVNMRAVREGDSIYHALQVKAERRFANGLNLLAAYTFSKAISDVGSRLAINFANPGIQDSNNLRAERSLANFDVPQRFVLSFTYQLPFGPGKTFLGSTRGALGKLVAGWEVNGVATFQNGTPLGLTTSVNQTNSFGGGSRPNNNGTSAGLSGSIENRLNQYFNTSVFSQPAAFTFGNTARTLPDVFAPGTSNFDFSIVKNTYFFERYNAQLRGEFFNGLNNVNFGSPGTTFGTSTFGVISSASDGRVVQLALKFLF
ncbi:MAG: TonB-dependent receptor [Acidobacteriaceae bacterium]|nr:TonB-dependent receptor [Acidobacteriaceae bacterium]